MSAFDLHGRRALVTGGAQGLGQGMAEALAAAGAAVVIGDVNDELGRETAQLIGKTGATTGFVHLDVTDESSWAAAVTATVEEIGGLDVLVNNAGVEITSLVVDIDPGDLRRMLEVNVVGTALGMKHGLRAMRPGGAAGGGGAIVNVSSQAGLVALAGHISYGSSKAALDNITRVSALELGRYGIRVNSVNPTVVMTEMSAWYWGRPDIEGPFLDQMPLGRWATEEEIAAPIVFLLSDGASMISGVSLPIDGGYTAR
jgi:NAD(P)-dependent dehydrogenase (short-subunit alcohol dehydrogenase family)